MSNKKVSQLQVLTGIKDLNLNEDSWFLVSHSGTSYKLKSSELAHASKLAYDMEVLQDSWEDLSDIFGLGGASSYLEQTGNILESQIVDNSGDISGLANDLILSGNNLETQAINNTASILNLNSNTVKTTGNQDIAGDKVFSNNVIGFWFLKL